MPLRESETFNLFEGGGITNHSAALVSAADPLVVWGNVFELTE
jgi:hypothetical protein